MYLFFCVFFFFKQKTAYEMRISDWSSDVCSTDLHGADVRTIGVAEIDQRIAALQRILRDGPAVLIDEAERAADRRTGQRRRFGGLLAPRSKHQHRPGHEDCSQQSEQNKASVHGLPTSRSEEHTSELQSLMRNPYAVLCL